MGRKACACKGNAAPKHHNTITVSSFIFIVIGLYAHNFGFGLQILTKTSETLQFCAPTLKGNIHNEGNRDGFKAVSFCSLNCYFVMRRDDRLRSGWWEYFGNGERLEWWCDSGSQTHPNQYCSGNTIQSHDRRSGTLYIPELTRGTIRSEEH